MLQLVNYKGIIHNHINMMLVYVLAQVPDCATLVSINNTRFCGGILFPITQPSLHPCNNTVILNFVILILYTLILGYPLLNPGYSITRANVLLYGKWPNVSLMTWYNVWKWHICMYIIQFSVSTIHLNNMSDFVLCLTQRASNRFMLLNIVCYLTKDQIHNICSSKVLPDTIFSKSNNWKPCG